MKRLLVFILAMMMCFCLLPSCSQDDGNGDPTAPTALSIVENGASNYEIVYSNEAAWMRKLALNLRNVIKSATGVELNMRAETAETPATDRSIVIRAAENASFAEGYDISVSNETLSFLCGSKTGAYFALCAFVSEQFGVDLESGGKVSAVGNSLSVKADLHLARAVNVSQFPYLSADAKGIAIAYEWTDYMSRRMAIHLRETVYYATGEYIDLETYFSSADELEADFAYLVIADNDTLANGDWRFRSENNRFYLEAADYLGYTAALRAFEDLPMHDWGFYEVGTDVSQSGNYVTSLKDIEETSLYAFERQGEHRVIFYNALFGNGTGTGKTDVPISERNPLQQYMIDVYKPDVIALQEIARNKRQLAGNKSIVKLLGDLGYVETVDPRVINSKPIEEGGWGVVGERVTDEDGNTFYTNYNMDPLFYNTATTRCIASEYHWFVNHPHELLGNDATEFSTKGSTWGVFESIATGERYIVVSAHLGGQDRTTQRGQAEELSEIIADLVEKYQCPAFLGGDFNGTSEHPFYKHLTEEADFISLQDQDGAKITSKVFTTHGYPRYNEHLGIISEGGGRVWEIKNGESSIDKVFATNLEKAEIELFGVVVDECSLSSSDHLPMVVDFNIDSK